MTQCSELAMVDLSVERSPAMGGCKRQNFVELARQKNVSNA